jgi:hypothetical protein
MGLGGRGCNGAMPRDRCPVLHRGLDHDNVRPSITTGNVRDGVMVQWPRFCDLAWLPRGAILLIATAAA